MKKYFGLLSEVSDIMYQNQVDVDAYVKIAKKYKGPILELGSGSGHISLELAKEGYDVTCLEIQRDMIHLHEKKLDEKTRSHTKIVLGDMCTFDLEDKFDLIIAPNNVIAYLYTAVEFLEMLISVKKHLTNQGVFVIETVKPNVEKMMALHGNESIHYYTIPRNHHKVEERIVSNYNPLTQEAQYRKTITEFDDKRIRRRVEYQSEEKRWFESQIKELLKEAGLSIISSSASVGDVRAIDDNSEKMVFYIKKV
jgi:2-polyprenyl-3-methyl-5-hydroxy-6-metoxy-1,4-benzoquinol methylase